MTTKNTATLTLCADDYGLAPGVSQAIRALIASGRIQAAGCMTGSPHWPQAAQDLKPLDGMAQIGLHLTLTDHTPLGAMPNLAPNGRFPSLGALLKRSLTRTLDRAEITAEFERQVDAFQAHFGRLPDFLDGHHHIHQLPVIGDVTLDIWRRRLGGRGWVRSCVDCPVAILRRRVNPIRALVIAGLGAGFTLKLWRQDVPHNASFRGVYDFSGSVPFAELFRRFTDRPRGRTLMMVHPGVVDETLRAADSLTSQREVEFRFLASDEMVFSLSERKITLARLYP